MRTRVTALADNPTLMSEPLISSTAQPIYLDLGKLAAEAGAYAAKPIAIMGYPGDGKSLGMKQQARREETN